MSQPRLYRGPHPRPVVLIEDHSCVRPDDLSRDRTCLVTHHYDYLINVRPEQRCQRQPHKRLSSEPLELLRRAKPGREAGSQKDCGDEASSRFPSDSSLRETQSTGIRRTEVSGLPVLKSLRSRLRLWRSEFVKVLSGLHRETPLAICSEGLPAVNCLHGSPRSFDLPRLLFLAIRRT